MAPTTIKRLTDQGLYLGRASAALAAQPVEGVERAKERIAEWWDVRRRQWKYDPADAGEDELQRRMGVLPPGDAEAFQEVRAQA
jgi:hypothetical protein